MIKDVLIVLDEQFPSCLSKERGSCCIEELFDDWTDEHYSATIKNVQVETYTSRIDGQEYHRCFLWVLSEVDENGIPVCKMVE